MSGVALHVANGCGNGSASVPCATTASPVTPAVTAAMAASELIILAIGEKVTDNDHEGKTLPPDALVVLTFFSERVVLALS